MDDGWDGADGLAIAIQADGQADGQLFWHRRLSSRRHARPAWACAGATVLENVVFLQSDKALDTYKSKNNFKLGVDITLGNMCGHGS
jgi:hypothetical protein